MRGKLPDDHRERIEAFGESLVGLLKTFVGDAQRSTTARRQYVFSIFYLPYTVCTDHHFSLLAHVLRLLAVHVHLKRQRATGHVHRLSNRRPCPPAGRARPPPSCPHRNPTESTAWDVRALSH